MDRGIMSLTATVAAPFASVTAAHRAWTLASFGYRHDQKYQCLKQKLKWTSDKVTSGLVWGMNQGYLTHSDPITITPKAWDWYGEECMP